MKVRCYWHFVAGFIAGIVGAWCWGAPIAGTVAFCVYEIKQDFDKKSGNSHKDILEFCIALFVGFVAIIPIRILGVA